MKAKTKPNTVNEAPRTLSLDVVVPNPLQPREYFNAEKMRQLRESIKSEGIMSPIIVMDNEDGSYMIIAGERRYRAAKELGHTEVPVIIEPRMDDMQMRVRQFQVEEYHEPWTPIERANAIIILAEGMGMTLPQVCTMLHVTPRDARRFIAFAELADKGAYVSSELPLEYVEGIKALKNSARIIASRELDSGMSHEDEKILEGRVIQMVKDGTVKNRSHIAKIGDAFKKEPEVLRKLLDVKQVITSPEQLFREAGAKGAHALRNTVYNAKYILSHGKVLIENFDVKITPEEFDIMMRARDMLNRIIDVA